MCRTAFIIAVAIIFANTALGLPGSGTEADPWRIQSLADFNEFAADPNYWDDYTRLETDVNLSSQTYTTAVIAPYSGSSGDEFEGIAFTGVFDGNDHKISGMTIDGVGTSNSHIGLFGYITGGQIMSLSVEGAFVSGGSYTGGLVGYSREGTVSGCYCSINVAGSDNVGGVVGLSHQGSLWNCFSTGDVGGGKWIGGLAGQLSGTASDCYSTCNVNGKSYVGGLAGHNGGVLWNSYFGGSVDGRAEVGGLVGKNYRGRIGNCYSTGNVSGGDDGGGGLVGLNERGDVSNCFWDAEMQIHGTTKSISRSDNGTANNIAGLSTPEMQTESTYTSAGWDFPGESANGTSELWQIPAGGGYPVLSFFSDFSPLLPPGSGTSESPYLISDANDIGMVMWCGEDSYFKLTGDVNLAGIHWSTAAIPRFSGHFDGNGHSLLNLQMDSSGNVGFFGYVGQSGEVKDLGLERISVRGIQDDAGALVGENRGSVSNCYSAGDIRGGDRVGGLIGANYGDLSDCYSTVDVIATDHGAGGLVGYNYGSITNSHALGPVSGENSVGGLAGGSSYGGAITNCYATGSVEGELNVGGLAGESHYEGGITNCYATGSVTGSGSVGGLVGRNRQDSSIVSCNATGSVTSSGYSAGGLVGRNDDGRIANCWATASVTGSGGVGGLVGGNDGGIISSCYASGPVSGSADGVGGLAGYNDGGIANCYAGGSVTGIGYVGGLVGNNGAGTIRNCYARGLVGGSADHVGGLVGYTLGDINGGYFLDPNDGGGPDNGLGSPLADSQMRQQESFFGWDFVGESGNGTSEVWQMPAEGGYPVLSRLSGYAPRVLAGAGVPDDPYLIRDANELGAIHHYGESACYRMTADIDLAGIRWSVPPMLTCSGIFDGNDHVIRNLDVNTPAADYVGLFGYLAPGAEIRNLGIEDASVAGQSHVGRLVGKNWGGSISNCDVTGSVSGYDHVGGLVGANWSGSISNCDVTGSVSGYGYVGGLVGENRGGSVSGCYASGPVTGGSDQVGGLIGYDRSGIITNCYTTGSVDGDDHVGGLIGDADGSGITDCYSTDSVTGGDYVGGLVGYSVSEITNCHASGIVTGRGGSVGGLVGHNRASVTNCYASGSVSGGSYTGGLVGRQEGIITGCYATGSVSGYEYVGGLTGRGGNVTHCYATGSVDGHDNVGGLTGRGDSVTHCYAIGPVSGNGHVGGLIGSSSERAIASFWDVETSGQASSLGGKGATTIQMKSMATYGNAGWSGETWVIEDGVDYPRLVWEGTLGASISGAWPVPLAGTGAEDDPYQVSAGADFAVLSWHISILDKHIELMSDVDLEGVVLHPIGDLGLSFSGVFDGHGHAIINVDINIPGSYYVGLFSYLEEGGRIENLRIEGGTVSSTGNDVGCIAGISYGTISNCYTNCDVSGIDNVGGLIGRDCGSVIDCSSVGSVQGTDSVGGLLGRSSRGPVSNCSSSSDVNGVSHVGGLVGMNGWYYYPAPGRYSGSEIISCDSTGDVSGYGYVGGLIGGMSSGSASNCFATGRVDGTDDGIGGLVGYSHGTLSSCYSQGEVSGDDTVGGLAGGNSGDVSDCYSTSAVGGDRAVGGLIGTNLEEGSVSDCNSTGDVSGNEHVGGLVGHNYGTVSDCFAAARVVGTENEAGGLVGANHGSVSNCYSLGQTSGAGPIGGLVGRNYESVWNCFSTVNVNGVWSVGGLVGDNNRGSVSNCYSGGDVEGSLITGGLIGLDYGGGTVSNCYSTSDVNGVEEVGGLFGMIRGASVSNCFWDIETQSHGVTESFGENDNAAVTNVAGLVTLDMTAEATFISAGWDFLGEIVNGRDDIWGIPSEGYPQLVWMLALPGGGTEEDPYRIETPGDFDLFVAEPGYWDDYVRLECDIYLYNRNYSNSVIAPECHQCPTFGGVFDGNGHKIIGLTIDATGIRGPDVALFGLIEWGTVKNLGIEDVYIIGDYDASALVGENIAGLISECYSTGYIKGRSVGGLVGSNQRAYSFINPESVITNCYSSAIVVGGSGEAGGLVGYNDGISIVSRCYSTGDVSGDGNVGGLVGSNQGTVLDCFWDTESQEHGITVGIGWGNGTATNVAGLSTADMQTEETFTSGGWDFLGETDNGAEDFWDICEGTNYPRFVWQIPAVDFVCPDGTDFRDYSFFASHWGEDNCVDSNDCQHTDFDFSGGIDANDLAVFLEAWLGDVKPLMSGRASNPNPPDGAFEIESDSVLSWTPGLRAASRDVYLGTEFPGAFQGNQTEATFAPGTLDDSKIYYWHVDEIDSHGNVAIGPVWSFRTGSEKGRGCFPADTIVWVDGEMVEISRVAAGTMVDKPAVAPTITDLQKTVCAHQIEGIDVHSEFDSWDRHDIVFENGNTLAVADSHYFLLDSGNWARVEELIPDSKLSTLAGSVTIKTITRTKSVGTVYNLKIKDSDRYLVGEDGIIVRDW